MGSEMCIRDRGDYGYQTAIKPLSLLSLLPIAWVSTHGDIACFSISYELINRFTLAFHSNRDVRAFLYHRTSKEYPVLGLSNQPYTGLSITAPLRDAVGPKFSPRSCRVYSNLAPRSKMLPTALRDSQFFRRVYAVVTRWRYFSSASTLCKLFPIVIESRQAKRVAV